jgi:hypothetical protein
MDEVSVGSYLGRLQHCYVCVTATEDACDVNNACETAAGRQRY